MSDIIDMLDSSSQDSMNLNVDSDSDDNGETPFQKLVRLHSSQSNFNDRKNAVKYILDALRFVNDLESLYEILSCTQKLADDIVSQVQIDTLEKFVTIIEYLIGNVENGCVLIKEYLFGSIVQTIGHANNRIRKASQSALLRLFELDQIDSEQIQNEIIPNVCQLDKSCDDFKNEAILLMTRLTQYVSNDLVLKYFVPTIIQQSSSIAFQTRKTCATSLADLSTVIPSSAVDEYLIPCLQNLCNDPFWGVRKSCAEVIHPLGQVCSNESRWKVLSPCLIQLLQDQSRWVKTAALRILGYFISTFHNQQQFNDEQQQIVDQFNDFLFWRQPILVDFDDDEDQQLLNIHPQQSSNNNNKSTQLNKILPEELLEYYKTIVEQSYSSGVETDIVHQGAFTFPAVALTLTNENWDLIKDLHKKFAEDLQWKVRRTLAYSLHIIGEMLTVEQVEEDLCPIFDSFIRDVDEVKIGILSNLSKFLKILSLPARRNYLDKLTYLTSVDNQRNWRFRSESANQLYELTCLYDSNDIADYLSPLAFGMSVDKVADVRYSAIKALSGCYLKFHSENAEMQMEIFLDDSYRIFASSEDWKLRQLFVYLCELIHEFHRDTPNEFALRFLSKLLLLKDDPVVNVRLSLGTFLYQRLHQNDFYSNLSSDWKNEIDECLQMLLVDRDRDVQLSVGAVYQPTTKSLSSLSLDEKNSSDENQSTIEQDQINVQS